MLKRGADSRRVQFRGAALSKITRLFRLFKTAKKFPVTEVAVGGAVELSAAFFIELLVT